MFHFTEKCVLLKIVGSENMKLPIVFFKFYILDADQIIDTSFMNDLHCLNMKFNIEIGI